MPKEKSSRPLLQVLEKNEDVVAFVVKNLDDGKAFDLQTIDLKGRASFADVMIVASGTSARHVMALAKNLEDKLRSVGFKPHVEGTVGNWVVLDLGFLIVHIFNPESRAYYALEEFWKKN